MIPSFSFSAAGSHIIDILNSLEPDVMGVTKREFSFYEDELSLRSYEAAFPLVASNVIDNRMGRSPDGLHTSVSVEKRRINSWCYISST